MARFTEEAWLAEAQARATHTVVRPSALGQLRSWGAERLARIELPGRRTESWKYSRVGALLEEGLLDAPDTEADFDAASPLVEDACCLRIVDGVPRDLPELPAGVELSCLSGASAGAAVEDDDRPFVALNAALVHDGVRISVEAGVRVEQPLEIQLLQNAAGRACGAHPRVYVEIGAGAELNIIERQLGGALIFTNTVIEVRLGDGARLVHHRVGLDAGEGRWLTALDVRLQRNAHYGLHQALCGARFRRNEIRIHLDAPGAHAEVGGATLTRDAQHLDTQMCLEHAAPHCTSNQVFRSIAGEKSRTILNGRIHIHRDAQKTAAELSTKNLLLSPGAEIDAKPELEIYADDVTCAHGATVGQLDPTSLFYLRSRGIDVDLARTMLGFAFIAGVVADFPLDDVRTDVRAGLEAAFSAPAST